MRYIGVVIVRQVKRDARTIQIEAIARVAVKNRRPCAPGFKAAFETFSSGRSAPFPRPDLSDDSQTHLDSVSTNQLAMLCGILRKSGFRNDDVIAASRNANFIRSKIFPA